jgi:hypothetical protein
MVKQATANASNALVEESAPSLRRSGSAGSVGSIDEELARVHGGFLAAATGAQQQDTPQQKGSPGFSTAEHRSSPLSSPFSARRYLQQGGPGKDTTPRDMPPIRFFQAPSSLGGDGNDGNDGNDGGNSAEGNDGVNRNGSRGLRTESTVTAKDLGISGMGSPAFDRKHIDLIRVGSAGSAASVGSDITALGGGVNSGGSDGSGGGGGLELQRFSSAQMTT